MSEPILTISNLYVGYDKADVIEDASLSVAAGGITCLLGSNGMGKTTLIRAILGLTPARQGAIVFKGRDITRLPTHKIVRLGIASIPEGRKVFPKMSVAENLRLGAFQESSAAVIDGRMQRVFEIFPRLRERMDQTAGTMSGGEQAMVSIGRGLMGEPALLIVDEPSLGLSPLFVKENFRVIKHINDTGVSVFLVEQNVKQTLAIAHTGYILAKGRVAASGTARELEADAVVREAYFG